MIQQSTTLIGLTNPSTFHISNWSWIWRVATMDAQGPWIHDRLAPLSSQAQMAAAWPMMPHDAEQSHVAICHVHLSCAYTTTVPLLPRSKKALLRLGPSRQLCWHHSCLLAHRGKDLRSWLGAGETDRWRVKSWCRFVISTVMLTETLTAGLLAAYSMIQYDLSYESLGFQEILGRICHFCSLLVSPACTALLLAFFFLSKG
jgi:hypothetical protein